MADAAVVERVRAGNRDLYRILVERHQRRLYWLAFRILRNHADAEDTLQDAHLRAVLHAGEFEGRCSFLTWVSRIVVNEATSRLRARQRHRESGECATGMEEMRAVFASLQRSPEQQTSDGQLWDALHTALKALPHEYRSVFVRRELHELTTMETARCLGITEECVRIRLFRARALLGRRLGTRLRPGRLSWSPMMKPPSGG
jgi:RNA polymerase sigma-70 factor (ECF subfamily)